MILSKCIDLGFIISEWLEVNENYKHSIPDSDNTVDNFEGYYNNYYTKSNTTNSVYCIKPPS